MFYVLILGNDDEDMDPEKVEIDLMDEAEFRNKKIQCLPKEALSTRQKLNKRYSAVASRQKVKCVSKKISKFHFCSLSSEDVSVDSNGDPCKSSSFVKKGDNSIFSVLPVCESAQIWYCFGHR